MPVAAIAFVQLHSNPWHTRPQQGSARCSALEIMARAMRLPYAAAYNWRRGRRAVCRPAAATTRPHPGAPAGGGSSGNGISKEVVVANVNRAAATLDAILSSVMRACFVDQAASYLTDEAPELDQRKVGGWVGEWEIKGHALTSTKMHICNHVRHRQCKQRWLSALKRWTPPSWRLSTSTSGYVLCTSRLCCK
jgi:hypothetical protein